MSIEKPNKSLPEKESRERKIGFQPALIDAMTRTKNGDESAIRFLQNKLITELAENEEIRGIKNRGSIKEIELLDRRRNSGLDPVERLELRDKTKMVRITFDNGETEEVSIQEIAKQYNIVTK